MISKEVLDRCSKLYHLGEEVRDISHILNEKVGDMCVLVAGSIVEPPVGSLKVMDNVENYVKRKLWEEFEGNINKKQVTIAKE